MSDYLPRAHELAFLYRENRPFLCLSGHSTGPVAFLPLWGGQPPSGNVGNFPLRERGGEGRPFYWNIRDLCVRNASDFSPPDFRRFLEEDVKKLYGEVVCLFARGLDSCQLMHCRSAGGQDCTYLKVAEVQGGSLAFKLEGNPGGQLQASDVAVTALSFYEVTPTSTTPVPQEVKKMLERWLFDFILTPLMHAAVSSDEVSYRDPQDRERRRLLFNA